MAKKTKLIGPVPQNLIEVNVQIVRVGELDREYRDLDTEFAERLAALKEEFEPRKTRLATQIEQNTAGLKAYADANRDMILPEGAKSVAFVSGVLGWRTSPPKVRPGRGGEAKLLQYLRENRMLRFVRLIREVNKERLLEERPVIPGVKYEGKEEFYVTPNDERTTHEVVANVMVMNK